jgi:hypothetical protein
MKRSMVTCLAALVLAGPLFAEQQQRRVKPVEGVLYDAAGKRIGPFEPNVYFEGGNYMTVLVRIDGELAFVPLSVYREPGSDATWDNWTKLAPVGPMPYPGAPETGVVFESTDCSGAGYINGPFASSQARGAKPSVTIADRSGGGTLYVAEPVQPQARSIQSAMAGVAPGVSGCQRFVPPVEAKWIPITRVIDLGTTFRAPYSLR